MEVPFKGGEYISGCSGIQARGGLIHEQQGGLGHQLQTNVDPLTLPSTAKTQVHWPPGHCLIVEILMRCALGQCLIVGTLVR